ncbi:ankyrin repeat, SAM and basic leucine zipper [Dermatophagoides farinae]|uniref:Ankyrin repeat, SAM and basic leucine zipper n=1 Tax=Dermatophagoides farinae TaxID=6954 RepID=A0A922I2B6_DERFA|nr:ankyrin repeat, SAM and basic leucine zipper [Dermatophagoides farinae]
MADKQQQQQQQQRQQTKIDQDSLNSITILKTTPSSAMNNNNVVPVSPVKSILKPSSTMITPMDEDLDDDEEYEYEEYEVDEDEEIDEENIMKPLKSTIKTTQPIIANHTNTVANQQEQPLSMKMDKIPVVDHHDDDDDKEKNEYEDEEIEYEDEEIVDDDDDDDEEYDRVANRIDELLNKTSDLKQEYVQNKSNIDDKLATATATTEQINTQTMPIVSMDRIAPPQSSLSLDESVKTTNTSDVDDKYKAKYDDDDDDDDDNKVASNLASLKHASNKWNIAELNDDDDDSIDYNRGKPIITNLDSDDDVYNDENKQSNNEYRTKNPIIQRKLEIHNAIQANKKKKRELFGQLDDDDDEEEIGEIEVALEENFIEEEDENILEDDGDDDDDGQKVTPEMLSNKNYQQLDRLSLFRPTTMDNVLRPISPSSLLLQQVYETIINRRLDQLQTILENVSNFFIDSILRSGWTALMYASYFAYPEFIQFCLKRGADVNYHNDEITPLLAVCLSRNNDETQILHCMKLLLENGARIEIVDHCGRLPLHHAARLGLNKLVKCLCHHGIDVNRIDHQGFTALHYAVVENYKQVIETLLEQKTIRTDIQNSDGLTACQLAKSINNYEIADILHQAHDKQQSSDENQMMNIETNISKAIPNPNINDDGQLQQKFVHEFVQNIITNAAADAVNNILMDNTTIVTGNIGPEIKIDSCPTILSPSTYQEDENEIVPEFMLNAQVTDLSKKYSIDLSNVGLHPSSAANVHYGDNQTVADGNSGQWKVLLGHLLLTFFVYVLYKTLCQLFFG